MIDTSKHCEECNAPLGYFPAHECFCSRNGKRDACPTKGFSMATEFPKCRWRGQRKNGREERYECNSPKLVVANVGVDLQTCMNCHCIDHEPIAPGQWVELPLCVHRGEMSIHPPEAPDNVKDWRRCGHPQTPLGKLVCLCKGCGVSCPGYTPDEEEKPTGYVAPLETPDKWWGDIRHKTSDYRVSITIPHLDTFEMLELAVQMWRKQTVKPYLIIVDTGSPPRSAKSSKRCAARTARFIMSGPAVTSTPRHRWAWPWIWPSRLRHRIHLHHPCGCLPPASRFSVVDAVTVFAGSAGRRLGDVEPGMDRRSVERACQSHGHDLARANDEAHPIVLGFSLVV